VKRTVASLALQVVLILTTVVQGDGEEKTFYPPSVYMQSFTACSADKPCARTEEFRVNPVPAGCCVLTVANGDGRGNDEVASYEVFLNGERVVQTSGARYTQVAVKLLAQSNTLKVVIVGKPSTKVFLIVNYDPRQSN
jgi:hypothetical protein